MLMLATNSGWNWWWTPSTIFQPTLFQQQSLGFSARWATLILLLVYVCIPMREIQSIFQPSSICRVFWVWTGGMKTAIYHLFPPITRSALMVEEPFLWISSIRLRSQAPRGKMLELVCSTAKMCAKTFSCIIWPNSIRKFRNCIISSS